MNCKELVAPCGIDCFNCQMYEENMNEQTRAAFAAMLKKPPEEAGCKGCRAQNGCRLHYQECETLDCTKAKGVDFCYECGEFPCSMLAPALDGADKYPHNLKLYNLCRMKLMGIEEWAREASENRQKYFKGRFIVGKGPVME